MEATSRNLELEHAFAAALVILLLLPAAPAPAASLAGVNMADQLTVGGKSLKLNGLGVRAATMLKVKVYVMGLYLEEKSSDPKAIIESDQTKRIVMRFVHAVTADELREGWREGFDHNYKDVAAIQNEIAKFNASMRDVKSRDEIVLDFHGEALDLMINGAKVDSIQGSAFQQAALSIWLGRKPPNAELKTGILGG